MRISKKVFGSVNEYDLEDELGQVVTICEYGCAIRALKILGRDGELHDVALGYDTLDEYINDTRYFGATVGRYANRIADGKFTLNGITYNLPKNDGNNTLHGGFKGFCKRVFASEVKDDEIIFTLHSADLDEGFPGNFDLRVRTNFSGGVLSFDYEFTCDKDTPASITNHNYFNLNGHDQGSILNHDMFINSERYCKVNDELLALGPAVSVEGTRFDFRELRKISEGGYDHCYELLNHDRSDAIAIGDKTGIKLEVLSNYPAMQFYSGNMIGEVNGKNGATYHNYEGFALECQQFPNAMNDPSFPDPVIKAGEQVKMFIKYKFSKEA